MTARGNILLNIPSAGARVIIDADNLDDFARALAGRWVILPTYWPASGLFFPVHWLAGGFFYLRTGWQVGSFARVLVTCSHQVSYFPCALASKWNILPVHWLADELFFFCALAGRWVTLLLSWPAVSLFLRFFALLCYM